MSSWNILGHEAVTNRLSEAVTRQQPKHAYLFSGVRHVGKLTTARRFAAGLICEGTDGPCDQCINCQLRLAGNHPDYRELSRENKVGIEQIRDLKHYLTLKPHSAAWRVAVIPEAQRLGIPAQNALLKLLEEPPPQTVLILTAPAPGALLPTTVSRCQQLSFALTDLASVLTTLPLDQAKTIIETAAGRPGLAMTLAADPEALAARLEWDEQLRGLIDAPVAVRLERAKVLAERVDLADMLEHWLSLHRQALLAETGVSTTSPGATVQELARHYSAAQLTKNLEGLFAASVSLRYNPNVLLVLENALLKLGE